MNVAEFLFHCAGAAARQRIQDGDGRLTGNDALRFFAMSNLSKPELKQVN
jgi:hypothetical protein